MPAIIKPITALLLSVSIILAANGLEGMLLPLRAANEGFSPIEIGLIGSAYFTGLTIGCLVGPRVIARVGHIRAFTVFAAIATISPLIEAIWPVPGVWWLFRGLTGLCFAGILNIVESWLTSVATNANRGRLMSGYAMLNFGSLMLGQQLINIAPLEDFRLFTLSAILCSLAAVPLALTLTPPPALPRKPRFALGQLYRVSPAAVAGCLGAGLANGAFWALAPIYARDSGLAPSLIPAFASLAIIGGALAQWPVGRLSDRLDRRRVIIGLSLGAALTGGVLFALSDAAPLVKLALAALFGACALPVYWMSFAHANDLAERGEAVNISSTLMLLYGVGAIFGPLIASVLKQQLGHGSLFLYTASVHVLIALAVLYRMTRRASQPPEAAGIDDLPLNATPGVLDLAMPEGQGRRDEGPVAR